MGDVLDGYEKIVSAFVNKTCKTRTTAMSIIYDIELNCTERSLSNIDSP